MRSLEIVEPGIQATVQDYPGRRGMQAQGFFPAGPMDHLAHRAANLLVGNPASAATLEITLGNFRARLERTRRSRSAAPRRRSPSTATRSLSGRAIGCRRAPSCAIGIAPEAGFRFYLGIDGGFDVPLLFGSRATYTMGALGGLDGRPLQQGDRLQLGDGGGNGGGSGSRQLRARGTRASGRCGRCAARRQRRTI